MPKFKMLTVAENEYNSDRLSCAHETHFPLRRRTKISINLNRSMEIHTSNPETNGPGCYIHVSDVDIDSLIEFLKEVKTFISEEEMIKKLMGTR